jgi:hypothetical protein
MARRTIAARGFDFLVSDDIRTTYLALVTGSVVDEVSGGTPVVPVAIRAVRSGTGLALPQIQPVTLVNGSYCLAGYADQVFPDTTQSYQVDITASASGYVGPTVTVTIPPNPHYPVEAGQLVLQPTPVGLRGRVTRLVDRRPVSGALVQTVDDPVTPPSEHVVALRGPLNFAHPATIGLNPTPVQPLAAVGGVKHLFTGSGSGPVLQLDDRTGLQPGDVVAVGAGSVELGRIQSLGPGISVTPGDVTLDTSLAATYAAGTPLQGYRISGAPLHLKRDAFAGDGLVLLDATLSDGAIEIADVQTTHVERQVVGALSDADGYYAFRGLGRVPSMLLRASAGALHSPSNVAWTIAYGQPINIVDLPVR